jgi:ABC-type phosphate transport system substrate-binding protein
MKRMLWMKVAVSVAAAAAVGSAALPASATLCTADPTTPLPNPVFITGSSAVQNFLAGLGQALAGTTTIIYTSPGSCNGVDAVFNGTKMGTGTAIYWDSTGTAQNCTLANETADVGVSDVYYSSCTAPFVFTMIPAGVAESFGPNQVMNFVVPFASNQSIISAQAAYLIYGFGSMTNVVTPFTDPTTIFQRGAASGTQSMLAKAIGVPADKWKPFPAPMGAPNVVTGGSNGMLKAVVMAGATSPNTTIGILASDVTDKTIAGVDGGPPTVVRSEIKILAYQHYGQQCAWLPDSTSTAFDKRNVRHGHYPLWGPLHFYTKTAGLKQQAKDLVGYFAGTTAPPASVNLLDLEIKGHTVPTCAMKVQRSAEIGPMTPYKDTNPCGCYMEELLSPGSSGCMACTGTTGCSATQTCSHGYCEAM